MNKVTTLLTALLMLFVASHVSGQSPRRRSNRPLAAKTAGSQPTPQTSPTPAPVETPVAAPKAPVLLATVNGENITTADIDPRAREEVDALDEKIADARKQILSWKLIVCCLTPKPVNGS